MSTILTGLAVVAMAAVIFSAIFVIVIAGFAIFGPAEHHDDRAAAMRRHPSGKPAPCNHAGERLATEAKAWLKSQTPYDQTKDAK